MTIQTRITRKLHQLRQHARFRNSAILVFVFLFAAIGTIYMLRSQAATPFTSIEPEQGTITAPATIVANTAASGGSAVSFGGTPATAGLSIAVSGNKLIDGSRKTVVLHGVNRSGPEYMCIDGGGPVFDGPNDAASIDSIKSWRTNAVRIPLNEQCWLGINGLPNSAYFTAAQYRQAIVDYVNLLHSKGLYAILDLQWAAPGSIRSDNRYANKGLEPMPDADHAPDFWTSVSTTFKNDPATIFDLFNEPYPDNNSGSAAAWSCWRDGRAACNGRLLYNGTNLNYTAVGMQELVNTVRATGATNVIMLPGVQYSNTLTQWLANKPADPLNQLTASWHSYDLNICNTQNCWDSQVAPVAAQVPVVAGEIGDFGGEAGYVNGLMTWLDGKGISYLGWTWDTWGCGGAVLISNYNGTACAGFGAAFKSHLLSLP